MTMNLPMPSALTDGFARYGVAEATVRTAVTAALVGAQ